MKIGIDARICAESWYYPQFVWEMILTFCEKNEENKEHEIIVYAPKSFLLTQEKKVFEGSIYRVCDIQRNSLITDIQEKKLFQKEKFHKMIFFDYQVPYGYAWDFLVFVENLKEVFFPRKEYLHRFIYKKKLAYTLKKAKKVITFDGNTALELNEQLNIHEDKIEKISAFFPHYELPSNQLIVDIMAKHNLRNPYLIYDSGNELYNNFERILRVLSKLKEEGTVIYLVILSDETAKDLDIRAKCIELWIADQIEFVGSGNHELEKAYYSQSIWVLFTTIYESFPFAYNKAQFYKVPIFANDIPANREVFGESISYFDPLSLHQMMETLQKAAKTPQLRNYDFLSERFTREKTIDGFIDVLSRS